MSFNFTSKGNPFGANNTSGGSAPSLFGSTANASNAGPGTPAAKTPFGGAFGGGSTGGSNLFGGGASSTTPATSKPNSFSSGFGFAKAPATGGDASNTPKPSPFGQGTPGGASTGTAPSFAFNAPAASASTPSANKTFTLNSTTPAGPPPGTSLFGNTPKPANAAAQGSAPSLFAPKPAAPATSSAASPFGSAFDKPAGGTPGGGNLFNFPNKNASADAGKNATPQQPPTSSTASSFGGATPSGNSGMQATPKPSLFGLGSTTPAATPASKSSLFNMGTTPAQPFSSQPATTPAAQPTTAPAFGLGQPATTSAPKSTMFPSASSAGGFQFPGAGATTSSTSAAPSTSTAPAGGVPQQQASTAGANTSAASGGATTSSASPFPAFNIGGAKPQGTGATPPFGTSAAQPSTSTSKRAPATTTTGSGTLPAVTGGETAKNTFASSTAGPTPTAQSRLKNKSMDEIITRWAADLSKYQKEFQSQAEQVARWDQAIVQNANKINQLYSKTFQADRDATEVERQLRIMEENQDELESYLDKYEREVEEMMKAKGLAGQEGARGPDQERERTYKLAEKLQDRLNDLNKDLTEMIEEINTTSQALSKTGKPDDPLTKVVKVLNSQLSQLQLIDSGASQLQEKIKQAQNESQRTGTNGWNGLGTDPSDDFYRSFRGGRTERFGGVS